VFAGNLPPVYSQFAVCLLQIYRLFASSDPDYDIDRELETNVFFKTQNWESQIKLRKYITILFSINTRLNIFQGGNYNII
jgi:hypothetical protein